MTDITPALNELLRKHNTSSRQNKFTVQDLDGFLKEAYRINSHIASLHNELKDVRQAYLSTAQPRRTTHIRHHGQTKEQRYLTDRDREEVDANAKQMLRELNAGIRSLEEAETLRRETEAAIIRKTFARGLGVLGAWAAGGGGNAGKTAEHAAAEGRARDVACHRNGVLWYLRRRLQLCGRTQQDMMEARLTREMEKNRSVLAKAGGVGGGAVPELTGFYETMQAGAGGAGRGDGPRSQSQSQRSKRSSELPPATEDREGGYDLASDLTEEQIQMFEKGNLDMVQHFNSTLDKVRTAEKSLLEISELQTLLVGSLATQSAHIEQLVADSENTAQNVTSGNKQLKEATKRPSAARYTFFASAGLCTFLILWDLIV
ncbi:snare-complex protein syntaxin-18 [Sodiomyces alkalinus F11]|uniref:Snare-complex protein syntaxin-18 n=1 Tax=Sodiomyces alkalinus (strain CBS 110278 / VKM F-3762 / F11) TaxID=1314773 RepID=A0A3N2Q526_SODAK|nr:snare-complex protein syntaxin-18 [Sodiomyces alkalinus F11]ROT41873.1 snare-complex protein syntaxin-18 [Sodiomyces alkalinus F11]